MEMQRHVKYPLLLEGIAKSTVEPSLEFDAVHHCAIKAKEFLHAVNAAKHRSENLRA